MSSNQNEFVGTLKKTDKVLFQSLSDENKALVDRFAQYWEGFGKPVFAVIRILAGKPDEAPVIATALDELEEKKSRTGQKAGAKGVYAVIKLAHKRAGVFVGSDDPFQRKLEKKRVRMSYTGSATTNTEELRYEGRRRYYC